MNRPIIIGTRGSQLALWQAHFTRKQLEAKGFEVEIQVIKTKGDQIQHLSFDKIEGKGFFTKEIEMALLNKEVDLAVHSYKDLPTSSPPGLCIAANSYRANPFDCLIIKKSACDPLQPLQLKREAIIGTSSSRRKAQLKAMRRDLEFKDIRGNVPTRIHKLTTDDFDAIVLAQAGLDRLAIDLSNYEVQSLNQLTCVPAAAQGVLAFQIRENDTYLHEVTQHLHDADIAASVDVERSILAKLDGGCQQPIGIFCEKRADAHFHLWISRAESWEKMPRRWYFKHQDRSILQEMAFTQLYQSNPKSVFISRQLNTESYLYRYLQHKNYIIHASSLISFAPLIFKDFPQTDWLFFSSKRGVKYFFDQQPTIAPNCRIATIGSGTAKQLNKYNRHADFIGEGADTLNIATAFAQIAKHQSVLFPTAQNSLNSIQKNLPDTIELHQLTVYKNNPVTSISIPKTDIIVLTSPMNVQAYLTHSKISPNQKIIAIGNSTAQALNQHNIHHYELAFNPDEISLGDICY